MGRKSSDSGRGGEPGWTSAHRWVVWLMTFDACGAGSGIIRSAEKSLFTMAAADDPATPYTALNCRRRAPGTAIKYLGVEIGDEEAQFMRKVEEMRMLHEKIREVEDPALELMLTQRCADVGKVMHLLRAVGPRIGGPGGLSQEALAAMDESMTNATASIVRTAVTEEAGQQAGWSVKFGGLGLRPGSLLALPAHLASTVEARPFVEWLADEMESSARPRC